jgi:thiamine-phosphate pyrophosphorylase
MGGVNSNTLSKTIELGYKGVGVLGGVWNTDNPVESFIELKKEYAKIES